MPQVRIGDLNKVLRASDKPGHSTSDMNLVSSCPSRSLPTVVVGWVPVLNETTRSTKAKPHVSLPPFPCTGGLPGNKGPPTSRCLIINSAMMGCHVESQCFRRQTVAQGGRRGRRFSRRLVARTIARQVSKKAKAATAPFQHALSTKAGCECVAHISSIVLIDGIGACNLVSRNAMLQSPIHKCVGRRDGGFPRHPTRGGVVSGPTPGSGGDPGTFLGRRAPLRFP